MKKHFLFVSLFFAIAFSSSAQQIMNCAKFCVISISNLDTAANTVDVAIWNADTVAVNYPTVIVVDAIGDTVINKAGYFSLFADTPGDTTVQSLPTNWDSIPTGFTGTVYMTDQVWDSTCAFSYPMTCTVGINEYADNFSPLIYPDPASDNFTVSLSGLHAKSAVISVYDMQGRKVRQIFTNGTETGVRRDGLVSGIYFVEVVADGRRYTSKVVLE